MDDEFNFTDTPTSSWFPAQVQFEILEVAAREEIPAMYWDQGSVSTFHPNHQRQPFNTHNAAVKETKEEHLTGSNTQYGQDMDTTNDTYNQVAADESNVQTQSQQDSAPLRGRSVVHRFIIPIASNPLKINQMPESFLWHQCPAG